MKYKSKLGTDSAVAIKSLICATVNVYLKESCGLVVKDSRKVPGSQFESSHEPLLGGNLFYSLYVLISVVSATRLSGKCTKARMSASSVVM